MKWQWTYGPTLLPWTISTEKVVARTHCVMERPGQTNYMPLPLKEIIKLKTFTSSTFNMRCHGIYHRFLPIFQLVANFSDVADFVVIYIAEAHPIGGFDFKENKFQVIS